MSQDPALRIQVYTIDRHSRDIYFCAPSAVADAFKKWGDLRENPETGEGHYILRVKYYYSLREVSYYITNYKPE